MPPFTPSSRAQAITLRFLPPDVDREALLPPLRRVFEQGRLAAATQASESLGGGGRRRGGGRAAEYSAVASKRRQFAAISRDLNQIFFDFPFAVPEYFALITRALIVLEGRPCLISSHLGASRRISAISAHLGASRRISAHLGKSHGSSRLTSAHLGPSRFISAQLISAQLGSSRRISAPRLSSATSGLARLISATSRLISAHLAPCSKASP